MRRIFAVVAVLAVLMLVGPPGQAAGRMKVLGTDASFDGPPAADLTGLAVAKRGSDLHIQLRLANALPVQGGYPKAGIEWSFDVRGRTYIAEAHPEPGGQFLYTLFEVVDGALSQKAQLEGAFDPAAATLDMFVPLRDIGASRGTTVSGTGPSGTEDVDIHQHAGPVSPLLDAMATTKDFVVP